ncbi:hypothetical protein [Vibrio navarrensis]|uniref:hypothetical protein n=1 Tax=Vibrio navarrensis TaxID=29495 RepID=UPI00051CD6BA|nr:hypothetical protein [Vibrio navarrensis]KGK18328.1 hypothetical protein EA25_08315 [Vibrio navarrensis]
MDWIYLSVSVQSNSKVVTVHNQSTSGVRAGDGLLIPGFGLVQVSGVFSGQLELKLPWASASQQNAQAAIVPTFGDFDGAAKTMRDFTQTTQANFAEMEKWWTQTGTVKFKGQDNTEHTVRTAKQMDVDVASMISSANQSVQSIVEQAIELGYNGASIAIVLLSGGRLELIKDAFGNAQLFGIIPIQTYEQQGVPGCPFTGIIDAFRKVDGTYLSEKRIAIHKSVNVGGKTVSQAGKAPYVSLNFDEFKAKAAELGSGFRLLDIFDNALINWIILGIVSRGGQAPRGNTEWGRAHDAPYEIGTRVDGQVSNTRSGNGATLTGSGPESWTHDGTAHGITDWVGNAWEWVDGLKMSGGEFVVAEYSGQPESEWLRTGRYINAGHLFSMTAPPSPVASSARWGSFGKTSGYVGHELLQRLMIEPIDCTKVLSGNFWYNTDGERSPYARASWHNGAGAGPVALSLNYPRSHRSSHIGGRLASGS